MYSFFCNFNDLSPFPSFISFTIWWGESTAWNLQPMSCGRRHLGCMPCQLQVWLHCLSASSFVIIRVLTCAVATSPISMVFSCYLLHPPFFFELGPDVVHVLVNVASALSTTLDQLPLCAIYKYIILTKPLVLCA